VTVTGTVLKVALVGAHADAAWRLADRLNLALAESAIEARVVTFDAAAASAIANPDPPCFDAIFLRGIRSSDKIELSQQTADELIRAALRQAETGYQVIYGSDEESLSQVLRAIKKLGAAPPTTATPSKQYSRGHGGAAPWVWLCDKCSDPQCEHRLLTTLLEQRQTPLQA
jgi:hypothetical protein